MFRLYTAADLRKGSFAVHAAASMVATPGLSPDQINSLLISKRRTTTAQSSTTARSSHVPLGHALWKLWVYIHRSHHALEECRAVLNATPCKTRRCPLWRCGKHSTANQLMAHIQTHASNDLEAAKSALETEDFLIESTTQNGIAVHVICPVCHAVSADTIHFMQHLTTDHLQTSNSGGYVHFEKWKAYWNQKTPKLDAAEIKNLLPWSHINGFSTPRRVSEYRCPCCSFSVADIGGFHWAHGQEDKRALIREHHRSFLRPEAEVVAELYPHRMAILRLLPEFVTHPVFADFDQFSQQSTSIVADMQE